MQLNKDNAYRVKHWVAKTV